MENRYIGKCECLSGGDIQLHKCLKRYYRVFDPIKGEHIYLVFCNDYLKLTIHNSVSPNCDIRYEISNLICKELNLPIHNRWNKKGINVLMRICDRPFVYWSTSLKTAIDYYLQNRSQPIFNVIKNEVLSWAEKNERYKNHNKTATEIKRILNKLRWTYDKNELEILANELMLFILQTLIKSDETN
jgi:hypothetical protein